MHQIYYKYAHKSFAKMSKEILNTPHKILITLQYPSPEQNSFKNLPYISYQNFGMIYQNEDKAQTNRFTFK